jgi:hypothetical protein
MLYCTSIDSEGSCLKFELWEQRGLILVHL